MTVSVIIASGGSAFGGAIGAIGAGAAGGPGTAGGGARDELKTFGPGSVSW
jgi:hypothetical protein